MSKTTWAIEKKLNSKVSQLDDIEWENDLTARERMIVAAIRAVADTQYTIAQHMDEDRADNDKYQNRSFVLSAGILVSTISGVVILVLTNL